MSDAKDVGLAVITGGASLLVTEPRAARKEAAADSRRARQAQQKIENIKSSRQRRKAVREARLARASIESGAQASGTAQSSSAVVGAGTVGTQLASNLSFLDQVQDLNKQVSIFQEKSIKHTSRAADLDQVRDLAFKGASIFAGGF